MSRTLKFLFFTTLSIVAAVAGALLARSLMSPSAAPTLATGTVLQPARVLPAVQLTDQHGAAFGNARFQGRWSLLFFGFTNCGDVCPTTMALLAATVKSLDPSQKPQVVFVSVDAKRDSPEAIERYLKNFDAEFIGVTGTQADLESFAAALGMPSGIRMFDNGSYAVDHSAAILAVNPRGELRAIFSPPHRVDSLSADLRLLLQDRG